MEASQLYIPDEIVVGYQKREDTYTKQLGYVIYRDKKGVLRKEKSWQGWRDKKIKPSDFKNEPTEGFVLNRDVGGARRSYGWNARIEKVRVYDPRGFEFEIDIANLLFILKECDCSRGKGLEGKFVYAWRGTELTLIPITCEEYKQSTKFTELQHQKVFAKDLVPGVTYLTKKQQPLTFIGKFDYHFLYDANAWRASKKDAKGVLKRFVFLDRDEKNAKYRKQNGNTDLLFLDSISTIAAVQSDSIDPDLAELQQRFYKSEHGSKFVKVFLKQTKEKKLSDEDICRRNGGSAWFYEESPGVFVECSTIYIYEQSYDHEKRQYIYSNIKPLAIQKNFRWTFKDGTLTKETFITRDEQEDAAVKDRHGRSRWYQSSAIAAWPGMENSKEFKERYARTMSGPWYNQYKTTDYVQPTSLRLFAELESGAKYLMEHNTLRKDNGK